MKKPLVYLLVFLGGCTPIGQVRQDTDAVNNQRRPSIYADLCEQENMPRYNKRPKLRARDLRDLPTNVMDARIMQHIESMEKHIDSLEAVVLKTRRRVELCR